MNENAAPPGQDALIPAVPLPAGLRESFLELYTLLPALDSNFEAKRPLFDGLPRRLELPYVLVDWIFGTNETIGCLNVLLADLTTLDRPGNELLARRRYSLLVRTFFHECFRVKEEFFRVTKSLQKLDILDAAGVREWRGDFVKAFEYVLDVRHRVAHSHLPLLKSEKLLALADAVGSVGYGLRDHATGEVRGVPQFVRAAVDELLPSLRSEGTRLSQFVTGVAEFVVSDILPLWSQLFDEPASPAG